MAAARKGRRRTVLLVHPDAEGRRRAAAAFTDAGLDVRAAATAREALEILTDPGVPVDVLLTGRTLDAMDAATLAELAEDARPGLTVLVWSFEPTSLKAVARALGAAAQTRRPMK